MFLTYRQLLEELKEVSDQQLNDIVTVQLCDTERRYVLHVGVSAEKKEDLGKLVLLVDPYDRD